MILGVDLGNYAVKTSVGVIFPSKCSRVANILSNSPFMCENLSLYIGEGGFDTEYRKVKKEHIKSLFSYAVSQSTNDFNNKVVVGLPLSQYKQDKDEMRELLLSVRHTKRINIDDIAVYPEGVAAVVGTNFEGVVIDIGGRTTDACLVTDNAGSKKVNNPLSMPKGTLNLYSDFVKILNSTYALDLKLDDGERIVSKGLIVDGVQIDYSMAIEVFRQFVEELIGTLRVEYSLRTNNVILVGGGAQLLYKSIYNRIPGAKLADNSVYANAYGFRRVGEQIWR